MIEKRKFPRVKLSSRTVLSQNNVILHGRLENISKSGALVRLVPGTHVPKGSEYDVTIYLDGEEFPLQISAELVNINFNMLGLKFTAYDEVTETRLDSLSEISGKSPFSGGSQILIKKLIPENKVKILVYVVVLLALVIGIILQFYLKTGNISEEFFK